MLLITRFSSHSFYALLLIFIVSNSVLAKDNRVWLATQTGSNIEWQSLSTYSETAPDFMQKGKVPLGSLWKLFVWIYLDAKKIPEQPYRCMSEKKIIGEEFCCDAGQQIEKDEALANSCGLYFSADRLHISAKDWLHWWKINLPNAAWLHSLNNLKPEYTTSVDDILQALNDLPIEQKAAARKALLGRLLQAKWRPVLGQLGSALRFKTFTWNHPENAKKMLAGGAGWTADGQAFWVGGEGYSLDVFTRAAPFLHKKLTEPTHTLNYPESCVDVNFFARYPIQSIHEEDSQKIPQPGSLFHRYRINFQSGSQLTINGNGQLQLAWKNKQAIISGKFTLSEYLARVLDREADANIPEAAAALAIAARSWIYQNAEFSKGCWHVDDSSQAQRISPNPPSEKAWQAVWHTMDLKLSGQTIRYRSTDINTTTLAWQSAVKQAHSGANFLEILTLAYPQADFISVDGKNNSCQRLPAAELWLEKNLPKIRAQLYQEPGFESIEHIMVCQLNFGNPYSDQQQQRIWIRRLQTHDDRVTLLHEYLHLAFRHHPSGLNENYLEKLARKGVEQL